MRHRLIGTVIVGLTLAATPARAQYDPGPPHAGTQVRCCSDYRITVHRGLYVPPRATVSTVGIPPTWPVVTIVAWPEPPTGNAYGLRRPGHAVQLDVWDPTEPRVRLRGTAGVPLVQPYDEGSFPVTVANALGGAFRAAGRAAIFHASHLPAVVKVRVTSAEGRASPVYTVRLSAVQ